MDKIADCKYRRGSFLFVTDPWWKHAHRTEHAKNNLIFVTEGVLYIEIFDKQYIVKPNDCIFLPHGVPSMGYKPSGSPTGFFYVLFDSPTLLDIPTHFTVQNPDVLNEMFSQLIYHNHYSNYPHTALNALFLSVLYEVQYQTSNIGMEDIDNNLVDNIKRYLLRSVNRNLMIADVAAHFNRSPDHIRREFRKSEHVTIKEYMNRLKIRQIEKYLASQNTSLKTIAEVMNFPNVDTLCKFYKYHTGTTPGEYRGKFVDY